MLNNSNYFGRPNLSREKYATRRTFVRLRRRIKTLSHSRSKSFAVAHGPSLLSADYLQHGKEISKNFALLNCSSKIRLPRRLATRLWFSLWPRHSGDLLGRMQSQRAPAPLALHIHTVTPPNFLTMWQISTRERNPNATITTTIET